MEFQIGRKYRILIPSGHKKREDRLLVGKVIQITDKLTTFQLKNHKESFLNWDLERLTVKEVK